jgi:methionyl-tRNA formyltransferase
MSDKVICIAGKNSIAINVLSYILEIYPQYKVVACINRTDSYVNNWQNSFGRYCLEKKVEILQLEDLYSISNLYLFSLEFDRLIDTLKFRSSNLFNIHFSLLPAYKGMYTSALPILHNVSETGVTLHLIDNGIDTGDIIAQEKIFIQNNFDCRDLYLAYLKIGEKLVIQNFDKLIENKFIATKQSSHGSSYYSKKTIDYKNIVIDLNKTANEIASQIRSFSFREYQLPSVLGHSIYKAVILDSRSFSRPGTLLKEDTISITISSVDYDVRLMKDKLKELHESAKVGDLSKIQDIYASGFDITAKDLNGWDILIIASYNGMFVIVKWILESGLLNVNTRNFKGTTAAMYAMTFAAKTKDKSILKYLIFMGADLKAVDQNNFDIFHYAQEYDIELYMELLNYVR